MAAPSPATRSGRVPSGDKLTDGKSTLVIIGGGTSYLDIALWEKRVTPPGMDGGEMIETGDMHNTRYKTKVGQKLINMTDLTMVCNYDPAVLNDIKNAINVNTTLTIHHSDLSSWAFYGLLRSFIPNEVSIGAQPEATVVIGCTNTDPSDGSEAAPVYTPPA